MLEPRPSIVCVLGQVDHGKTSLLDAIRETDVAANEKGGITQGIGAWAVTLPPEAGTKEGKKITFIDTPGHAAFSDMRREGAAVADVVLLVVDGADGVKPQTKESLFLIKEANIAYIVVLTKSDLPTFSEDTVLGELEKEGVALETRGGSVPYISVSAKTKEGIPALLELILLLSELNNVSSDKEAPLEAVVIEAAKEKAGITASLVVRNGTLKVKDAVFVGGKKVKVRGLFDDRGKGISSANPGEPAKAIGFTELPAVGTMVTSVKKAAFSSDLPKVDRDHMKDAKMKLPDLTIGVSSPRASSGAKSLRSETLRFHPPADAGGISRKGIKIVLKANTEGGREAVIKNLPTGVFVVASQTGDISESDILMAKACQAKVFVFEASIPVSSLKLAESEGVVIERFDIIYELLERLDKLVAGKSEVTTGKAEIVAIFPFEDTKVAGMRVKEGKIRKADAITLDKKDKKYENLKIVSMKRGKDDISEAKMGEEFGAIFSPRIDFAIGDMILSVAK